MTPLADSSVWVEALRAGGTPLVSMTSQGQPIGYTQPVLMELLSGCRSNDMARHVRRLVIRGELLSCDVAADFEAASQVYRFSRRAGVTPDNHIDCLIIAVAARHRAALLTYDRNQRRAAEMFGVTVIG